jgi:hypothetical protein
MPYVTSIAATKHSFNPRQMNDKIDRAVAGRPCTNLLHGSLIRERLLFDFADGAKGKEFLSHS